jgi:uncharacterized protein YaiE (UPF0345 family)
MIKVNEYFDGKVKSIAFENTDGVYTVGVMVPGNYEFGTLTVEVVTVVSGSMTIQAPDNSEWKTYKPGESFTIAKDKKFQVRIEEQSAYLCLYK